MNQAVLEKEFERAFQPAKDNWKALCPFHDENSPSFFVHKEDLIGNCFGCGTSGYIDGLLASYANISVKEARSRLSIKPRLESFLDKKTRPRVEKPPQVFPESWLAPWEKKVSKYTLERFINVGESRKQTFIVLRSQNCLYDSVGKRQVFPHRDKHGNLLGAAGRVASDTIEPKWYFYWGYERGGSLYRVAKASYNRAIVVEGIFDAVRLRMHDVDIEAEADIVCTLGTKLGKRQIRELKEYDEVVLSLDNDAPGVYAAESLYQKLKKSCKCQFVVPFEGKDYMELEDPSKVLPSALNWISPFDRK